MSERDRAPAASVLELTVLSIMGGTDVRPKPSRAERKARSERRRIQRRGGS
ncbi:MAG: hypothetical protein QOK21_871 [Solirubrobacteraceae bacterium]|jgi:hypothetical protein|nr:hypothetical protein [Solirubrobacteraceae bacterium]